MSQGVIPRFFHHGTRHISPDFTGFKTDHPLGLETNPSELDGEHHYLMEDSMQPSLDFSFVDMTGFVSPEPGDTDLFYPPTMFPDGFRASRSPSPPPTASNYSMPSSAPSSSPVPLGDPSTPSVLASGCSVQDLEAGLAVQEGWPYFRCNPQSKAAIYPAGGISAECQGTHELRQGSVPDMVHCGQVVHLAHAMPKANKSPWWAGALYPLPYSQSQSH